MRLIQKLVIAFVLLLSGCTASSGQREWKDASLNAIVTSDLHLSVDPNIISSIVPAMPYGQAVAETIASQIIDAHPDVFIMTGDNTNSGAPEDMHTLKQILQKITDAGIPVVMTTGNHDFNRSSPEEYWECFSDLFDVMDKAPDSLSYVTEINNVRIIAMDDNSFDGGTTGTFSPETMLWLRKTLRQARTDGQTVLFLSHHNVIAGPEGDSSGYYQITNPDLRKTLRENDVPLCLTGHQHGQGIQQEDGLFEIISSMPLSGRHQIGSLTIQGKRAEYHTVPISFTQFGEAGLAERMEEADRNETVRTVEIFEGLLKQEGLSGERYDGVMALIDRFFRCYSDGTFAEEAESLRNDTYYEDMITALHDYNYGPWMEQVVNHPPMDGNSLRIVWE